MIQIDGANVHAVDADHAFVMPMQALQEPSNRGLARPAAAHDAEDCAGGHVEREPVEGWRGGASIAEAHRLEVDGALERRARAADVAAFLGCLVDDCRHGPHGAVCFIKLLDQVSELDQRLRHALGQDAESHERAKIDGIAGGERIISRERDHAARHEVRERACVPAQPHGARDVSVPAVATARLERERFDRAHALHGLDQESVLLAFCQECTGGALADEG